MKQRNVVLNLKINYTDKVEDKILQAVEEIRELESQEVLKAFKKEFTKQYCEVESFEIESFTNEELDQIENENNY